MVKFSNSFSIQIQLSELNRECRTLRPFIHQNVSFVLFFWFFIDSSHGLHIAVFIEINHNFFFAEKYISNGMAMWCWATQFVESNLENYNNIQALCESMVLVLFLSEHVFLLNFNKMMNFRIFWQKLSPPAINFLKIIVFVYKCRIFFFQEKR